jgi:endoglucanase Acf2
MLIYTVHTLAKTPKLAHEGLAKLKKAFAVFAQNKQKNPLVYESKLFRGWIFQRLAMLTSSSGLEGSCVRSDLRHW